MTARELKVKHQQEWEAMNERQNREMREVRERDFPVGTKVTFQFGKSRCEVIVMSHPEYEWASNKVMVRNPRSGATYEKEIWELEKS